MDYIFRIYGSLNNAKSNLTKNALFYIIKLLENKERKRYVRVPLNGLASLVTNFITS